MDWTTTGVIDTHAECLVIFSWDVQRVSAGEGFSLCLLTSDKQQHPNCSHTINVTLRDPLRTQSERHRLP